MFDEVVQALDGAMVVVTATSGDVSDGCLVGFHAQVSIDPARYLVALSDKNRTTRIAADASHLAVHLVAHGQHELASLFGEETGDEVDKLAQVDWVAGDGGAPVLTDAPGWFVGRVVERVPLGDHIGHLLEVEGAHAPPDGFTPMRLTQALELDPGHAP